MNSIKIYGERNSGTNYFEKLVEKNLEIQILRYFPGYRVGKYLKYEFMSGLLFELNKKKYLGWKHGKPKIREINKFESSPLTIVTITKIHTHSYFHCIKGLTIIVVKKLPILRILLPANGKQY